MKLFYWSSEAFANYGSGKIAVVARDVGEARVTVWEQRGAAWREKSYMDGDWLLQITSEDDMEQYRDFLAALKLDISVEPKTTGVLFIRGSE